MLKEDSLAVATRIIEHTFIAQAQLEVVPQVEAYHSLEAAEGITTLAAVGIKDTTALAAKDIATQVTEDIASVATLVVVGSQEPHTLVTNPEVLQQVHQKSE